jgi:hypothetical protein
LIYIPCKNIIDQLRRLELVGRKRWTSALKGNRHRKRALPSATTS